MLEFIRKKKQTSFYMDNGCFGIEFNFLPKKKRKDLVPFGEKVNHPKCRWN